VKPILSIYSYLYDESKNKFRAKKKIRLSRGVAGFCTTKFVTMISQLLQAVKGYKFEISNFEISKSLEKEPKKI
jgi:hypothetical protein